MKHVTKPLRIRTLLRILLVSTIFSMGTVMLLDVNKDLG